MKTAREKRLLLWAGASVVLLALVTIAFWYLQKRPTLIDLQKEMLTAETDQDKQEILEKLDRYYLTMPIPEVIRQEVEDSVGALIQRFDPAEFTPEKLDNQWDNLDSNIYLVENQLRDLLRNAMIARRLEDMNTFQTLMNHAERLADTVDTSTDNNYWRPWVAQVKNFNANMAGDWLLAYQAEKLCYKHHLDDFERAEEFGSMAMQLLQQAEDERLRLDITQRLLVILFQYRGMYDLSFPLAERAIQRADEISYKLRAIGLTFNYAQALILAGYTLEALPKYFNTIKRTKITGGPPGIQWYQMRTRLYIADAYRLLGEYDKSLSIFEEIGDLTLDNSHRHILHNTKGMTYTWMGKYDLAENEYRKALYYTIAENNTANRIIVLFNMGDLNFRLTEYDKANAYYQDAMSLLLEYYPKNFDDRSKGLIRFAELEAALNNIRRLNEIIREVRGYIELINNPIARGRYLVTLGRLNMEVHNQKQASDYFFHAITHYESSGMFRDALETKTILIKSLMELNNYKEANKQLDDQYKKATELNDAPTLIDALGLSSQVAYKQENIEKAIHVSNLLINKVEELSRQISNLDILTTFRQKVNPYLKDAVLYELRQGRIDSAFIKLDYLKAREAKQELKKGERKSAFKSTALVNIDSLRRQLADKQILINYLATEDTLYAFAFHQNGLDVFRRAIYIDDLRHLGNNYINFISKGNEYLNPYRPSDFQANYDSVKTIGHQLFQILLDWPELTARLSNKETTYIIPDDILYGIPFSCLNETDDSSPQFLIQKTAIVNIPSAVFLQSNQAKTIPEDIINKRVLISADQQEFPQSKRLVSYIKSKFPESEELIVDKSNIEKDDVLSRLSQGYDIYFLIGHSIPNLKFPDLSNIQLTALRKSDKSPFRVVISLSDLKHIDWANSEMVFLIGCKTAVGKLYEGSGFAGFQQNLLARGAKNVMASLWEIDNILAFQQIESFLDSWENTGNPALAVQSVEIEWIQHLKEDVFFEWPHPILWKTLSLSQIAKYN